MDILGLVRDWVVSEWRWIIPSVVAILGLMVTVSTYGWRVSSKRSDTKHRERELLSYVHSLLDELIYSHSPDHQFAGLSSNVERSSEILANKKARQQEIIRELERSSLRLPSKKYDRIAHDLRAIAKELNWDEWRAIRVKNKLAHLINPQLSKDAKDEHALDDSS